MIRDKRSAASLDGGPTCKRVKLQDDTTSDVCDKHKLPLVIFCNEQSCQSIVCHTCVLLKHRDHKVMELSEKVQAIKQEFDTIWNATEKAVENDTAHVLQLNEVLREIFRSAGDAVDKIQAEKKKMITAIEKEAEEHIRRVYEIQENETEQVNQALNDVSARIVKLDETKNLVTKVKSEDNIHEISTQYAIVKQLFHECFRKIEDAPDRKKYYNTASFNVADVNVLQNPVMGNVSSKRNETQHELIKDSISVSPDRNYIGNGSETGNVVGTIQARSRNGTNQEIIVRKVKSWVYNDIFEGPNGWSIRLLCSSPTGLIYTAAGEKIQAFDLDGNQKMEMDVGYRVCGMICYHNNGVDMLVLKNRTKMELRDGNTCSFLDEVYIPNMNQSGIGGGYCQDSPSTVLVGAKMGKDLWGWKLVQCRIDGESITKGNKEIEVSLQEVRDITITRTDDRMDNRKLVVATGSENRTYCIIAIDYEIGYTLWKTKPADFRVEELTPRTVCSNGRNLFVSDRHSRRVVVMDSYGKMHGAICSDFLGRCHWVTCIPDKNKLVVSIDYNEDHDEAQDCIHVYDIKYVAKTNNTTATVELIE